MVCDLLHFSRVGFQIVTVSVLGALLLNSLFTWVIIAFFEFLVRPLLIWIRSRFTRPRCIISLG